MAENTRTNGTNLNDHRIEELLTELNQCREDERNTQNQLLQVLATAAAILGLLFGASFLGGSEKSTNGSDILPETYARVLFWISALVLLASFGYVIVLGMGNILRYYYVQDVEDRLRRLIPAEDEPYEISHPFLNWGSFSAPIVTRNFKHIASVHTLLYFLCYTIAIAFVVMLCIFLLVLQFLQIQEPEWYHKMGVIGVPILMLLSLLAFLFTALSAKKLADFARKTAGENFKFRKEGALKSTYQGAEEFRRLLFYFIYPKTQDIQKPGLIILGFVGGLVLSGQHIAEWMTFTNLGHLLFVLFVFDFLAYQARYQINDIRGIKEDQGRLLPDCKHRPEYIKYIKWSLEVAGLKAVFAIFLVAVGPTSLKYPLVVCLSIMVLSTILYEIARKRQCIWAVYILVGPGYPLRVFLGLWAAYPGIWQDTSVPYGQLICLALALWTYGSFSSLLSWAKQVTEHMRTARSNNNDFPVSYEKKHFLSIQDQIMERYIDSERRKMGSPHPLHEQGKIEDPWNIGYLLTLLFLLRAMLSNPVGGAMQTAEILAIALFGLAATDEHRGVWCFVTFGELLTILPFVVILINTHQLTWYMYLCLNYIRVLRELGIAVIFEKENINTLEADSEMLITILGAFAQAESESISANVRWGKRQAMREGKAIIQYKRLYGYRKGADGKPEIIPEQAKVVQQIYDQYLAGASFRQIQERLELEGVPNADGGPEWTISVIRGILTSEKYCGDVLLQKTFINDCISKKSIKNTGQLPMYLVENHHAGIVDRQTFDRVQAELARRNAVRSPSKKNAPTGRSAYTSKYALSERLVCGECGTLYRRCVWSKNGKKRVVWRCVSRLDYGTKYCHNSPTLDEEPLQRAILKAINSIMSRQDDLVGQITGAMELELTPFPGQTISLTDIQRQLGALEGQFNTLLEQAAEEVDGHRYMEQFQTITKEITTLKEQKRVIEEQRQNNAEATQKIDAAAALLQKASPALEQWDEAVIRQLVDTVKVISVARIIVYLRGGIEVPQDMLSEWN